MALQTKSRAYWTVPPEALNNLLLFLSMEQIETLCEALKTINTEGGYGSVRITIRDGRARMMAVEVTKEMRG